MIELFCPSPQNRTTKIKHVQTFIYLIYTRTKIIQVFSLRYSLFFPHPRRASTLHEVPTPDCAPFFMCSLDRTLLHRFYIFVHLYYTHTCAAFFPYPASLATYRSACSLMYACVRTIPSIISNPKSCPYNHIFSPVS